MKEEIPARNLLARLLLHGTSLFPNYLPSAVSICKDITPGTRPDTERLPIKVSSDKSKRNHKQEKYILKSIPKHWRLQNEATILRRYQDQTPFLWPLLDEIREPSEPASIVLKSLDTDLLRESKKKRLSRPEIKQVAKSVLQALQVLHQDGLVHTDVKLDNVFVNLGQGDQRFSTIQLGDCGGVVHQDSTFAKEGHLIGAGITRSPEATFQLHWGTATDIWSFGNAILSLIYGGDYQLFNPANQGCKIDDEDYLYVVLKLMYKFFGPFPQSYDDFHDSDVITVVNVINHEGPPERPFHLATTREIPPADKKFILKIMKLDPRDRPTAEQLLADGWFAEESEDTRVPLKGEQKPVDDELHIEEVPTPEEPRRSSTGEDGA